MIHLNKYVNFHLKLNYFDKKNTFRTNPVCRSPTV